MSSTRVIIDLDIVIESSENQCFIAFHYVCETCEITHIEQRNMMLVFYLFSFQVGMALLLILSVCVVSQCKIDVLLLPYD
jgi:hypothetical protein